MTRPPIPNVPGPPPDDDPTGVRALLSSLPAPEPMPQHLVERINASLAAEQAQRHHESETSATPLLPSARRRRGRLLLGMAGAAAALAMVTVVGDALLQANQATTTAGTATSSDAREDGADQKAADPQGAAPEVATPPRPASSYADQAPGAVAAPGTSLERSSGTLPAVEIRASQTRYTRDDFVAQAQRLRSTPLTPIRAQAKSSVAGPLGTTQGLADCLDVIGAGGAQSARADIAFYQGQPAAIIIATTNGKPVAYVVGRQCSASRASIMHPATPLP